MKVAEVKYTKRFNDGNYEHTEISMTVVAGEGDGEINGMTTIKKLKKTVVDAYSDETAKSQRTQQAGKQDKSPVAEIIKSIDNSETEISEDEKVDFPEPIVDDSGDSAEPLDEDDAGDEKPAKGKGKNFSSPAKKAEEKAAKEAAKKAVVKAEPKATAAKKPKGTPYSREDQTHKKLFGELVDDIAGNGWRGPKGDKDLKAQVQAASKYMEGQEFIDKSGEILNGFRSILEAQLSEGL